MPRAILTILAVAVIGLGVAYSIVGFPFEKPIIYYSLKTTQGSIVSAVEGVETDEQGRAFPFYAYTFTYTANGRKLTRSIQKEGRLNPEFVDITDPIPITVVYSSLFPSLAQVDDDGTITFGSYVIKGTLATLLVYGIALWVIVLFCRDLKQEIAISKKAECS